MIEFSLSYGQLPVALTVNDHCTICECEDSNYIRYSAGKERSESNSVMVAAFVLAIEQDIEDVPVEPDTD